MTPSQYFRPDQPGTHWPRDDMILAAAAYATQAHGNQTRRYTDAPYMVHCIEVARIVSTVTDDPAMLAAALLHDTVEDTTVTPDDLRREFGHEVEQLVVWLTDVSKPGDGNRAMRKGIDRAMLSQAPPEAKTIKLADLISNTRTIVQHDPRFAKIYLREKALLLEVLREGDVGLWDRAALLVADGYKELGL